PLRCAHWWPADGSHAAHAGLRWLCPEGSDMTPANWERDDRAALMVLFDAPPTEVAWLVLVHAGTDTVDFALPAGHWRLRLASDDDGATERPMAAMERLPPGSLWLAHRVRGDGPGATLS
ncbi:MAG: hypothetical protein WA159_04175, partial [Variovorax sp.]